MVLRAGLVGLGMMGRNHARLLQSTAGVELVAVVDPVGDASGAIRSAPVLETVAEMIDVGVDFCVVACPTEDHEPVALALAEAGVAALIEKPLAIDLPSAKRIVDAFESRGLVGAVGHIERSNAAVREVRRRIAEGELGELYQVSTRRVGPFPGRIRDVGVVKDLATHDLDLAAWVGGARFASIAAYTTNRAGRDYEDLVSATGRLENGVITNHLVNWLTPYKERLVVATGEGGCLVADTLVADVTRYKNASVALEWDGISDFRGVSEGDVIRYAIAKPEPLRVQLEAFRDAVLAESSAIVSLRDGLSAVEAADAAIQSSSEGRTVDIPSNGDNR